MYREWMDRVNVGSVLRCGNMFRIVRAVSHKKDGRLSCVYLSIKRCSWTHRCYTVVNYNDLDYREYSLVEGVRVKLESDFDKRIAKEFNSPRIPELSCCDVVGVY